MFRSTIVARRVVVVGLVVTVTACGVQDVHSNTDPGRQVEPEIGEVPHIDSYDDLVFPLDSYRRTAEERLTLARAEDALADDCLARYGFEVEMPERTVEPEPENRVIGVIEATSVARFGYKPEGYIEHRDAVAEAKSKPNPWTPEVMGVLNGEGQNTVNGVAVPEGGCTGEARRELGRNTNGKPGDDNFVIRMEGMASNLSEGDSRLKAAFAEWSECMANAGYHYSDPWQANGDPAFASDEVSAREIATAKADVACRDEREVNGIWVAVRTAYQHQVIDDNVEALKRHESAQTKQLERATAVLDG